jgi:serine/threonine protein kinase
MLAAGAGRVLGKYEILSHLATGGMAEIYLARATGEGGFEKIIVLKKMLPELAKNAELVELFLNEARLAATLDHSNIVQVYDVASAEGSFFIAMEYVHGQDVRSILRTLARARREIPYDVALSIAIGVCAGLHYAHEMTGSDGRSLQIVHRDVSPSNILVSYDGNVKLADFGIAKAAGQGRRETRVGSVRGKFGYMSPEQCGAKALDRRSDLFAIAIVLWELTAGRQLFRGDTEYSVMQQIVEQPAPRPSTFREGYPPALEKIVMRGLERDPQKRFQTAREMQLALEELAREMKLAVSGVTVEKFMEEHFAAAIQEWRDAKRLGKPLVEHLADAHSRFAISTTRSATVASGPPQGARNRRQMGAVLGAVVGLALAAVGLVGWRIGSHGPKKGRAHTVVVLGLKNLSGKPETAWLSTAAAEMLASDLGAGGELRLIPGEDVARTKSDLQLADAESYNAQTLSRVRGRTGADVVIVGDYFALGASDEKVRFDFRAQATDSGDTLATISDSGTVAQLPELIDRSGGRLRAQLGIAAAAGADAVRASMPQSPEAARLYAEGLARMRLFDAATARDLLTRAVAAEPDHPLPHAALGNAWAALGYDDKAVEEARLAYQHASNLPSEERRSVEADYRVTAREYDEAAQLYKGLWQEKPDRFDYGLKLATAQRLAHRGPEALATVESLRKLDAEDPRLDLLEAETWDFLSDFGKQRAAAVRAAERGRTREAWSLVALARAQEGWAERNLGLRAEATRACEEARRLFEQSGDLQGVSRALNRLAVLRYDEGDFDAAGKLYEDAIGKAKAIGAKGAQARALNNLALLRRAQGQLAKSRALFEEALALSHEVNDLSNVAACSYGLGDVLAHQGDVGESDRYIAESMETARTIHQQRFVVDALYVRSAASLLRGRLSDGRRDAEESLALAKSLGDTGGQGYAAFELGELLSAQGDLASARKTQEDALANRVKSDYQFAAAQSRAALGQVLLDEGSVKPAEEQLQQAIDYFKKHQLADDEAGCQALLARAFSVEHRATDERTAIERALAVGQKSERPQVRIVAAIAGARLQAPAAAKAALEKARADAAKASLPQQVLEARLALANLAPPSVRAGLRAAVAHDATASGFGIIARRAK